MNLLYEKGKKQSGNVAKRFTKQREYERASGYIIEVLDFLVR